MNNATNSTLHSNTIWNALGHGIKIQSGSGNRIWNNSFARNNGATTSYNPSSQQALDSGQGNTWNETVNPYGWGNYWSDWTNPDQDADGIVDLPYLLAGTSGSMDHLPLALPPHPLRIPPPPPENLSAIGEPLKVNLSWSTPASLGTQVPANHRIYRGNSTHRDLLAEIGSDTTYLDHDVAPEKEYHYHITAINTYGESGESQTQMASPSYAYTVPSVRITHPPNGSHLPSGTITVEWTSDGNGSPITGYEIQMNQGGWINMGLMTKKSFVGLTDGSYLTEVRTRNMGGGKQTTAITFQIDTIPPTININDPKNHSITNVTNLIVQWEGTRRCTRIPSKD
jgi:hypothetical protein